MIRAHIRNKTLKKENPLQHYSLEPPYKAQRMKALHINYVFFPVLREKLMSF